MALTKEMKIGALVLASILIFLFGLYFLKGSSLLSSTNTYYVYYDQVEGLAPSSFVKIKGVNVGKVEKIELNNQEGVTNSNIKLSMSVDGDIELPKGSLAVIKSTDLLGGKFIELVPGNSAEIVNDGETLKGSIESGLVDNVSTEISPLLMDLRRIVNRVDTAINTILNPLAQQDLNQSIASLKVTMSNFESISGKLNKQSDHLGAVLENANAFTKNLSQNNGKISSLIDHLDQTSQQLSKAPIDEAFQNLNKAVSDLQGILNQINTGDGSVAMLLKDKQLYTNLTSSLNSLDLLMDDLRKHPSRYINVTVFGRKQASKKD